MTDYRWGAQIVVSDGEMVCPQCEHVYRIKDSIPNMVRLSPRPGDVPASVLTRRGSPDCQLLAEHEIRK